ncbi:MAG: hypothetical protein HY678_05555 [Chloroflexi bacterium]|nr:hypothetical protein [Chloroflexota bacterium]
MMWGYHWGAGYDPHDSLTHGGRTLADSSRRDPQHRPRSDRFQRAWVLKGMTNAALGRTTDARADFEKVLKLGTDEKTTAQVTAELAKLK